MYLKCLSGDKTDMEKRQLELEEPSDDDSSQSGGEASSEEAVIIKETTSDKKKRGKKKRSKVDSVGTPTKIIKYNQEVKAEKQQASNLQNKKCSMHGSKVGGSFLKMPSAPLLITCMQLLQSHWNDIPLFLFGITSPLLEVLALQSKFQDLQGIVSPTYMQACFPYP